MMTNEKKENNVRYLAWGKYAVAACFVIIAGVLLWQNNIFYNKPTNDVIITNQDTIKNKIQNKDFQLEELAFNKKIIEQNVLYPLDYGFTDTKKSKKVKIIIIDGTLHFNYLLNKLKENKLSDKNEKLINTQIDKLKTLNYKFEFDGKQLKIYLLNKTINNISILTIDEKNFYINIENNYFYLNNSKTPISLKKVENNDLLEQLEKINFENE
jgi:hypothetical protein